MISYNRQVIATSEVWHLIEQALENRLGWFDDRHVAAFRLFNGFCEGFPELSIDLYGRTLVFLNYADPPEPMMGSITALANQIQERFPWIQSAVVKNRFARQDQERRGVLISGTKLDWRVQEHGVWYALDLLKGFDCSLYLDTRLLRRWTIDHTAGKRVLNCFAYTGSLGVSALAGGAIQVVQLDRSRASLNLAKDSYSLNGFPVSRSDFVGEDFFKWTSRMRRSDQRFDLIFLDPPFFSQAPTGSVDLNTATSRLINKVRPLLTDGGLLIAINNALFVSGASYLQQLEALCQYGYLSLEELIAVPPDFAGFRPCHPDAYPADPAPFNHPTKIAVLKVR